MSPDKIKNLQFKYQVMLRLPLASSNPSTNTELIKFYSDFEKLNTKDEIIKLINTGLKSELNGVFNGLANIEDIDKAVSKMDNRIADESMWPKIDQQAQLGKDLINLAKEINASSIIVSGDNFNDCINGGARDNFVKLAKNYAVSIDNIALGSSFQFSNPRNHGINASAVQLNLDDSKNKHIIFNSGYEKNLTHEYAHLIDSLSSNPQNNSISWRAVYAANTFINAAKSDSNKLSSTIEALKDSFKNPRASMNINAANDFAKNEVNTILKIEKQSNYDKEALICDKNLNSKNSQSIYYSDSSEKFARLAEASIHNQATSCSPVLNTEQRNEILQANSNLINKLKLRQEANNTHSNLNTHKPS